jgi:putative methionine-R-sulfoxide reductase with GAF domain
LLRIPVGSDINILNDKARQAFSDANGSSVTVEDESDLEPENLVIVLAPPSDYIPVKKALRVDPFENGLVSLSTLGNIGLADLSVTPRTWLALNRSVTEVFDANFPIPIFTSTDVEKMYVYRVPKMTISGTCSKSHALADRPFNLAVDGYCVEGGGREQAVWNPSSLVSHPLTSRLYRLNTLVSRLYDITQADWIGIYRLVFADNVPTPTLMKEAYRGEHSRALFPVTAEFALMSTNSWVALNGNVRIINDLAVKEAGVSYYECSSSVKSELCVPIFSAEDSHGLRSVIGIMDLESWRPAHFTDTIVLEVVQACFDLGANNLGLN